MSSLHKTLQINKKKRIEEENLHSASSAEIIALVLYHPCFWNSVYQLDQFINPHSTTLCSSAFETMALAENRIWEGIFFFFRTETTITEVDLGRNSAAGGLPALRPTSETCSWEHVKATETAELFLFFVLHLDLVCTHRMQKLVTSAGRNQKRWYYVTRGFTLSSRVFHQQLAATNQELFLSKN